MELSEKLQELRKRSGLTQEQLAEKLFVSRTAVSKWESGRGYPSIDSLKALAVFYSVTVDELLSGDEMLAIAEEHGKAAKCRTYDIIFALLDISALLYLFLPLFACRADGVVRAVSLLSLSTANPMLKTAYIAFTAAFVIHGIVGLTLQVIKDTSVSMTRPTISIALSAVALLTFILSSQVYAAIYCLVFLMIKGILLLNKR